MYSHQYAIEASPELLIPDFMTVLKHDNSLKCYKFWKYIVNCNNDQIKLCPSHESAQE